MFNCKQVAMRADTLLDAELGMLDWLRMRIHLLMCKKCAAFLAQIQITQNLSADAVVQGNDGAGSAAQIAEILQKVREETSAPSVLASEIGGMSDEKP